MKQKDLQLIACLRNNARETLTVMSRRLQVPISTLYDRLRHSEGNLIKKHVALVNFQEIGFATRAHVMLNAPKERKDEVREYLIRHFNTNTILKVNNGYDFMVEVVCRSMKEIEDFLEELDERYGVRNCKVYYIIEDIKQEGFFNDPQLVGYV